MGNGQSLFFPDNGNRHDRAQQLANECQILKTQFEVRKEALEKELGPYQEKINKVLKAFGCNDMDDLDKLVHTKANRQALEIWNSTKTFYDGTEKVQGVLRATIGIVAVAGLSISIVMGLASVGIGFFAGIGVTGDILIILEIFAVFLDAICGAINREKFREAINKLFPSRLKLKHAMIQLENMETWITGIKMIYEAMEDEGDSEDAIIAALKGGKFENKVRREIKTFYQTAQDLHNFDKDEGAWMNEDPDWQQLARDLDLTNPTPGRLHSGYASSKGEIKNYFYQTAEDLHNFEENRGSWTEEDLGWERLAMGLDLEKPTPGHLPSSYALSMLCSSASTVEIAIKSGPHVESKPESLPVEEPPSIDVTLKSYVGSLANVLGGVLTLVIEKIIDDISAVVVISADKGTNILKMVNNHLILDTQPSDKNWIISFGHEEGTERFKKFHPSARSEIEVTLSPESGIGYLCADGALSPDKVLASRFIVSYAKPN